MKMIYKDVICFATAIYFFIPVFSIAAEPQDNPDKIVTRVEMLNKCPVYEEGDESFLGGIATLLIPSFVEATVRGIGGAFKKAGEEKTFTTSDLYPIGNFYRLNKTGAGFAANDNIGCLVVFRAKVGDVMSDNFKKKSRLKSESADDDNGDYPVLDSLFKKFGIVDEPKFYYEAEFLESPDYTAFRFDPKTVFYHERIGGKSDDQLVMNISLALPSASSEAPVFAQYSVIFDRNGESLLIRSGETISGYGSGFIPLPPVSSKVTEALTLYNTQQEQLTQLQKQLAGLERAEDSKLAKLIEQLAEAQTGQASNAAKAQIDLDRAIADGESEEKITELERKLEDALSNEQAKKVIVNLENAIKERRSTVKASEQRINLEIAISKLKLHIEKAANFLNNSTPANISATLVETSNANKFLVKVGEFLEGVAPSIKEKVKEKLDSKDPKTQLESDVKLLTELNTLRASAITDVEEWRKSNVAYSASDEDGKTSALATLRIAFFKARLSCDIVEKNGLIESACLNLEVPPEPVQ